MNRYTHALLMIYTKGTTRLMYRICSENLLINRKYEMISNIQPPAVREGKSIHSVVPVMGVAIT